MTEIASHRGGAALWPENSETAFRETAKLPVEQIEFDVQLTAEDVPVIFHDATLDRVTDGAGPVGEHTLSELKALEIFNGGGKIMTLEEGLDILAPSHLTLRCEIKPGLDMVPYPGIVEKTLAALSDAGLSERTVVTSFHLPTLTEVRLKEQALKGLIWLVADPILRLTSPQHVADLAKGADVFNVSVRHVLLRGEALPRLRASGLAVGAFAVLDDEAIEWAFGAGVDVFTTDRPDAAVRIREKITG
ncbi:glycerophosphodiester phosphodiesterase family protein [uncultured Roseibium sp.]|uniref:glycerophosphodiester phosphodiesterase n=1 Tax=uncultured Roseibium sp. TaxID=1936171 RepID=UPI0026024BA2|nr:glycerophosphodiester phosphodiesterase family protein [uncultured Roseibium sp.]